MSAQAADASRETGAAWLSEVFASFQGEGSRAGQRHLFVRFAGITPSPRHGDVITINGIDYAVVEVDVDPQGSAVLKLRVL